MEKTVRILEQSALSTRKYTDKKTGQEKVMNAVTFKLTDGIDTFLGEVTGERAVNCPMYDKNYFYRVQCSMVVRDWMSQQTGEQMRKLQRSFKSNTRIYDDGSIEVDPQAKGEPLQKDVKKVGKSKRYVTNGKNPLTCVELKCPEDVPDKAAFFHKELAKLTKDIQIE